MRHPINKTLATLRTKGGIFFFAFFLLLTGCRKAGAPGATEEASTSESAVSEETASVDSGDSWQVGIAQFVQHPSLDMATQGFIDTLQEELGDQVEISVQNAAGEVSNVSTIVNNFVSQNVDLILANATAPLQVAAAASDSIPVLGTSVTDYASALELNDFEGVVGTNVSGTTDLAPFEDQVKIFRDLVPAPKTVGMLYASSEANSLFQVEEMKKRLTEEGYEVREYSFTDSNDIVPVTSQAVSEVDVLYIPTDNLAASNAEGIGNIVLPAKVPVITADAQTGSVLGVASISIDYYELGKQTAKMAVRVLKDKEDISQMKVESAPEVKKMINEKNATDLGINIPESYDIIEGTEVH